MTCIRVQVSAVQGSAPREAGATMYVYADHIDGTIGGGALEWEAMRIAREMLQNGTDTRTHKMPLGPSLGQCCGGAVTLLFERGAVMQKAPSDEMWVWGAGHVGRAIVSVLAPLPGLAITWVDISAKRFPNTIPSGVQQLIGSSLPALMPHAPRNAQHLILTYSHELDLDLCHGALRRGFETCGLIGSATKWTRFRSRLRALGHADAEISRIDCPIGDPSLGKHPQAIAVGVAARLIQRQMLKDSANMPLVGHG